MATFHAANTGNWQTAASWTENSGYPQAADTVYFGAGFTGTITLGQANACANLDMTGNAGTLAFGTQVLTVSASTKLYGTMTATSGNNLTITGGGVQLLGNCGSSTTTINLTTIGQTLTSGGFTWGGKLNFAFAATYVLSGNWINTGLVTYSASTVLNWTTAETITYNGGFTMTNSGVSGTAKHIIGGTGGVITGSSSYAFTSNLTINCTSCTFASGTFYYYYNTFLYTAGTVTNNASLIVGTAGSSSTLSLGSNVNWAAITISTNTSITLGADLYTSGIFKFTNTPTFLGAFNIHCATLYGNYNSGNFSLTIPASQTLYVSTGINLGGDYGGTYVGTIKSGTASSPMYINYSGTVANCKCGAMVFTDVDASGGNMINNYFSSTLTRTKNIRNITNTDLDATGSWCGTLAQETGANARGGSGSCVKLTPKSTSPYDPMYWTFLVPTTASTAFVLNLYQMISSGFNGTMTCTVYDTDNTTTLQAAASVSLTNDGAYHIYSTGSLTPTSTGFCRVVLTVLSSSVAGSIYVDDVSLS
jgi:hypothetical protein